MKTLQKVVQVGWDCHRKFSTATLRDASGRVVARQRLEHADRAQLRERLRAWPAGRVVL
jgi:hypothetical protein